jgi:lysozyme family protein
MRSNALRCIANTHREEGSDTPSGGWTINPNDPGNWTGGKKGVGSLKGTKYGIAANTYPKLDIRNLTRAEADAIYIRDYWPKAWGDEWPVGFDQITYDATVNSGPGRGPLWTCKALGFAKADRSAPEKARMLTTSGKVAAIKRAVSGQRMSFLRSLSIFSHFGKGWTGRCARMEAIGVKMVLEGAGNSSEVIKKTLEGESKKANGNSNKSATGAGGTAAGGGGAATQADPSAWGAFDWIMVIGGSLVSLAALAWLVWMFWKHRERFKAYADAARGLIGG